jgi:hypothetical protein
MTMARFDTGYPVMRPYKPGSSYNAGDVIVLNNIPLVAHERNPQYPNGTLIQGNLAVAGGVYLMASDAAYGNGTDVYWDPVKVQVTTIPTATTVHFGWVVAGSTGRLDDGGPTGAAASCYVYHQPNGWFRAPLVTESSTDSLTAHAGGGQTSALALTTELNRMATVATAGDSVKLPASAAGLTIVVINSGAANAQVFGAGTDKINDQATATGITVPANSITFFACVTAGNWYCEGTGSGYSGSFATLLAVNAVTAHAGGGQTNAVALTGLLNRVTVVATAGDSVLLPASAAGLAITVTNAAANYCNVFPAGTDVINGLGASAATQLPGGQTAVFVCDVAGTWNIQLIQPREVSTAIATVGAGTLTAAGIVGGLILRTGSTGAYTDTTDTAANIIAALHGAAIGQSFELTIQNNVGFVETLTGGTGVTLSGFTAIPGNCWARFLVTYSAAATVTMAGVAMGNMAQLPNTQFTSISSGNGTFAASAVEGAQDVTLATSGATAMTTRTAAQTIANIPNWEIGQSYRLRIYNTNGGTLTITGGTGVTITGTATIATNVWRDYYVTYTGANTVGWQNLGAGNAT